MTFATRHRRAASRSGGATSAERDGRPVPQRTIPDTAAGSESLRTHDSCARHRFPSLAPRGTRITGPAEHENSRTGGCAVLENVPVSLRAGKGTFSRGAPSGIAYRRSASQPPRRPSRRPEVDGTDRGSHSPHATAGRRAGAEARRAPNVTAGRCAGEPSPAPPRAPNPSESMIHVPDTVFGASEKRAQGRCCRPSNECPPAPVSGLPLLFGAWFTHGSRSEPQPGFLPVSN
jgi:hypothetical protein